MFQKIETDRRCTIYIYIYSKNGLFRARKVSVGTGILRDATNTLQVFSFHDKQVVRLEVQETNINRDVH